MRGLLWRNQRHPRDSQCNLGYFYFFICLSEVEGMFQFLKALCTWTQNKDCPAGLYQKAFFLGATLILPEGTVEADKGKK